MKFDPDRHHRRSIRLPGYDYSQPGTYFVTICTYRRECTLGVVQDRTVLLSLSGELVKRCWDALAAHFPFIELDACMIMPNHVHGLIMIKDDSQPDSGVRADGTTPRSLGSIIQNFKSVSTRKINQSHLSRGIPAWQHSYYERIVRDEVELSRVRQYIATNPKRWTGQA